MYSMYLLIEIVQILVFVNMSWTIKEVCKRAYEVI